MAAYLEVVEGLGAGKRVEVPEGESLIGRDPACVLVLPKATVSRKQSKLLFQGGVLTIEDLGSLNGTRVNNSLVIGPTVLFDQDDVAIDTFRLRVIWPESPQRAMEVPRTPPPKESPTVASDSHTLRILRSRVADVTVEETIKTHATRKLAALLELTNRLGSSLEMERVLPQLLDNLLAAFPHARRAAIYLTANAGPPTLAAVRKVSRDTSPESPLFLGETLTTAVIREGQAIISSDVQSDERFLGSDSMAAMEIRWLMCAPLRSPSQNVVGAIQLDSSAALDQLAQADLEILASVARLMGLFIDFARLSETQMELQRRNFDLQVAQKVQRDLLPDSRPVLPGYEFFDYYDSAESLGGDYYDYVALPDGRWGIPVADVCGKGVSAALLMSRLGTEVRWSLEASADPAAAMVRLNRSLSDGRLGARFVTMVLCVLDPHAHTVTIACAGHPPPYLFRAMDGTRIMLSLETVTGPPLGLEESFTYRSLTIDLAPGDSLLCITDGVSEAISRNNDLYGLQRPCEVRVPAAMTPGRWGQALLTDVKEYSAGSRRRDDICIVAFGRAASAPVEPDALSTIEVQ